MLRIKPKLAYNREHLKRYPSNDNYSLMTYSDSSVDNFSFHAKPLGLSILNEKDLWLKRKAQKE